MRRAAAARKTLDSGSGSLKRAPIQPPEEVVSKDVLDRVREKKRQKALGWLHKYVQKFKEKPSMSLWAQAKKNDIEFKDAPCSKTIQNLFNNKWSEFIKAGGYEPRKSGGQKLSSGESERRKKQTLQYLHAYVKKYGNVPSVLNWVEARKKDNEFENAPAQPTISFYFNSWNEFIKAGGYKPNEQKLAILSEEDGIQRKTFALQYLHAYVKKYGNVPSVLNWVEARKKDNEFENAPAQPTISFYFNSWNEFIKAGGYEPNESFPETLSEWEVLQRKTIALQYLHAYVKKYGNVPSKSNWGEARKKDSEFENAPKNGSISYLFTTWNEFIKAGGYEPNEKKLAILSEEDGIQRKTIALQYLHAYVKKYGNVPSKSNWGEARKKDSEFENALSRIQIIKYFNTWNEFIKAGGYRPFDNSNRKLSDDELQKRRNNALEYLNMYIKKNSEVPSGQTWEEARRKDSEFENAPSRASIFKYFNTWNEFIKAGGYEPNKEHLGNQDKQKIEKLFKLGKSYLEICSITGRSPDTVRKSLRKLGLFTPNFIRKYLSSISIITSSEINGVKLYEGEGKKRIRGMMLESTVDHLSNPFDVNYIGFPSANFVDYSLVYDEIGVSPEESLAVERERRIANVMKSIVNNFKVIIGGERFEGLNLHQGPLVKAVSENPEMQFNFFSLDFLGGWSPNKQRSVEFLFANEQVADEAVMFLTLNNSAQERMRLLRGRGPVPSYGTDNQHVLATTALKLAAMRNGFMMQELFTTEYQDSRIPMLVIGVKFERVEI